MSNFALIEECTESSAIGFSCLIPVKNFDQVLLMKKIGGTVSSGSSNLVAYPTAHAHRFLDTFSVELLLARVPIERVSILLGHQSVRITE
jgi:hypothetical protein